MSYAFLLRLSRSATKRIILIHRYLLTSSVKHEQHQADTADFIHTEALRHAKRVAVQSAAAQRHAYLVEQAADAELKTLPEYKA
jgi:hypothetical protein